MDQLMLAIITTLFIVAVIFILLGTEKHHKHLKKVISLQDSTIKSLRDENRALNEKVESKERYIVNLAANNAVMKQRVVELESELNSKLTEEEKSMKLFKETGIFIFKDGKCTLPKDIGKKLSESPFCDKPKKITVEENVAQQLRKKTKNKITKKNKK